MRVSKLTFEALTTGDTVMISVPTSTSIGQSKDCSQQVHQKSVYKIKNLVYTHIIKTLDMNLTEVWVLKSVFLYESTNKVSKT